MRSDADALPKRPFADNRIRAGAPCIDMASDPIVAEKCLQAWTAKGERQGSEGPGPAQVQCLPSRPIIAVDPARVKRDDAMPAWPELLIAPAAQAPGCGKIVLENRVAICVGLRGEQRPGGETKVPQWP